MGKLWLLLFLVWLQAPHGAAGQCCSPGSPTGGTASQGSLDKGAFRLVSFFQHSESNRYFEGSQRIETDYYKSATFDYLGLTLAYGWTERLTTDLETGYFFDRTVRYNDEPPYDKQIGSGLGDVTLLAKYGLVKNPLRQWEITLGAGAGIPWTTIY
jgi:hypothetical protein